MCLSGHGLVLCPATHPPQQPSSMSLGPAGPKSAPRSNVASPRRRHVPHFRDAFAAPDTWSCAASAELTANPVQSVGVPVRRIRPHPLLNRAHHHHAYPKFAKTTQTRHNTSHLGRPRACLVSATALHQSVRGSTSLTSNEAPTLQLPRPILFLSIENSFDRFANMLSYNSCNMNDVNPMLVATNVN
jgi:hypothetical protein